MGSRKSLRCKDFKSVGNYWTIPYEHNNILHVLHEFTVQNQWRQEQLYVNIPSYALVFSADRGPAYSGSIVVDDITVTSGPCTGEVVPIPGENNGELHSTCFLFSSICSLLKK